MATMANNTAFNEAMKSALNQFKSSKSLTDFQNTANTFNRISSAANTEWLPSYYQAQCYIYMSFMDKDVINKDAYLDIAETSINRILELAPNNSEAYALQSFMYTGRLVVDPMTRGKEYTMLSMTSIKKSLAINPTNPRALYLELSNEIGMAGFFGSDTSVYCERIYALLENWDSFNKVTEMYPTWGKNQVEGLTSNCQNTSTETDSTQTK
jgi:hypothetical protein